MNYEDALISMKEGDVVHPPATKEEWRYDPSKDTILRKVNGVEDLLENHPDILQALSQAASPGWSLATLPSETETSLEEPHWWEEVDFAPEAPRVLRRGDRDDSGDTGGPVHTLQRELNRVGANLKPDGVFGPATERAVRDFQKRVGLVTDGIFGDKTAAALKGHPFPETLQQPNLEWAARELKCEVAAIMAVSEVESRGRGFFNNGKPAILFERHWMRRRLNHYGIDPNPHIRNEPNIVNTKTGGYKGGIAEYGRLEKAQAIHDSSALESASWGAYQIMGFHWNALGYDSAQHYVAEMKKGERQHLDAFVRFIKIDSVLLKAIRDKNWRTFARRYNGPAFEKHNPPYDVRMANAYRRHRENLS